MSSEKGSLDQLLVTESEYNSGFSLQTTKKSESLIQRQMCKIHLDKPIDFFCQTCLVIICSKCIFHHHNGHDLTQLDNALKALHQKLSSVKQDLDKTLQDHEDNKQFIFSQKQEIEGQREKQLQIIDVKFGELHQKLDERKGQLTKDFVNKFDNYIFKVNDKMRICKESQEEIISILKFYQEMIAMLTSKINPTEDNQYDQIQILEKYPDLDKFINENNPKIKNLQQLSRNFKAEIQSVETIALKPIEVTVQTALNLIQTIQFDGAMVPLITNDISLLHKIPKPCKVSHSETSERDPQAPLSTTIPSPSASSAKIPKKNETATFLPLHGPQQINKIKIPSNIIPQSNGSNQDQKQQQQFNSKFARLRFSRQSFGSDQEEFQLQIETPKLIAKSEDTSSQQIVVAKEEEKAVVESEDQEEIQSAKIKVVDHAIFGVGDQRYVLMFDYKAGIWQQIYFDKTESDYQGNLKYMSVILINKKKKEFFMSGGCNKISKEASHQCYRFMLQTIRNFREVLPMKQARYGHASVFINQLVLALGGFNHRDDESQAPSTLNTCEKYSIKENEWTPIAPMHQERAYFSACRVKDEFIYVFGGFQNIETTNSVEFYNIMLDKWTVLSINMPLKLAKYGLAKTDENQVLIAGGLLVDSTSTRNATNNKSYSCVNTVYKFDCNTLKWTKLAKLNFRRTLYSTMPVKENGQVFAIGGTIDGINEVYDIRKRKWNTSQSYTSVMGSNDLQTFAIFSINNPSDISDNS